MERMEEKRGGHVKAKRPIPPGHPLRNYLRKITFYIFEETGLRDGEVASYVSDMLTDFAHTDNLYRLRDDQDRKLSYLVDMLLVSETLGPKEECEARRHIGDYCMFIAGIFPESINKGGRRATSPAFYVQEGKRAYLMVSDMGHRSGEAAFFNKLADKFERCVNALVLEREYLFDPFYQYLLRQLDFQ
jgi:hypothetical protein